MDINENFQQYIESQQIYEYIVEAAREDGRDGIRYIIDSIHSAISDLANTQNNPLARAAYSALLYSLDWGSLVRHYVDELNDELPENREDEE